MSLASPSRRTGVDAASSSSRPSWATLTPSPGKVPGEMMLVVTPWGPNSRASALVRPQTACFDMVTCGRLAVPRWAFMPVKLTIRPQPASIMPGKKARASQTAAYVFTLITRSSMSSVISRNGPTGRIAALLIKTSMRPNLSSASPAIASTACWSPMSAIATMAWTPCASTSAATRSQSDRFDDPLTTMLKPAAAR